jgi:flagellar protein FliJ
MTGGDMKTNQAMFTRFEVNNTTCKVAELERTICELDRACSALETQIENEESQTRVRDPADFAYSTFAKAARERRDRLRATVHRLKAELESVGARRGAILKQLDPSEVIRPF